MVSFWPFKGEEDAASFEKTLKQLSTKIQKASAQNDTLRQRQRRYKALWTLYTAFAYILVAAILVVVTGFKTWGPAEYSAVAGGPVIIYSVRLALDTYYNYRIARSEEYLNGLNKQRDKAIERLKAATKYNSTQQLLDKYGGGPRRPSPNRHASARKRAAGEQQGGRQNAQQLSPPGPRTGLPPPPTANIPGKPPPPPPTANTSNGLSPPGQPGAKPTQVRAEPGEEFAPNAFSTTLPPSSQVRQASTQYATDGPRWYDRILDVVLGEDETQAKNRIALICQNCKLVNGQAPPGVKRMEDIGRWRCSACHAWNGVENEANRALRQAAGEPTSPTSPQSAVPMTPTGKGEEDVVVKGDGNGSDAESAEDVSSPSADDEPPSSATRSRAKQRSKA